MIEFTIPGEPASKARARFTNYGSKVRTYTPAKTMEGQARVRAAYLAVAEPTSDPEATFGVEVEFLHETGQRRDVDNMLKLILDGLNKVAWPDDVQVTKVSAMKRRVPKGEAETRVTIVQLGRLDKPRGRCIRCDAEFAQYASTAARKYCTRECGYAHRRESRERSCAQCDVGFLAQSAAKKTEFCSIACNSAHKRVTQECHRCDESYSVQRCHAKKGLPFCSSECRMTHWREHRKSAAKGTCSDCGGPTSKKGYKRCRACNYAAGGRWADKDNRREYPNGPARVTVTIQEVAA